MNPAPAVQTCYFLKAHPVLNIGHRFLALLLLSPMPFAMAGCGSSDRPETAEIVGIVMLNGVPLSSGTIIFEPTNGRPARGRITDGQIVDVITYKADDGATVGLHKIAISSIAQKPENTALSAHPGDTQDIDDGYMGTGQSLIPERYNDPETSGLTAEIEPGQENVLVFDLSSEQLE